MIWSGYLTVMTHQMLTGWNFYGKDGVGNMLEAAKFLWTVDYSFAWTVPTAHYQPLRSLQNWIIDSSPNGSDAWVDTDNFSKRIAYFFSVVPRWNF